MTNANDLVAASPAWLSEMPAIHLQRSVPILYRGAGDRIVQHEGSDRGIVTLVLGGALVRGGEGCGVSWWGKAEDDSECVDSIALRVDLADPQGFAYALRYAYDCCSAVKSGTLFGLLGRWSAGETTDADRLALAQILVAVSAT